MSDEPYAETVEARAMSLQKLLEDAGIASRTTAGITVTAEMALQCSAVLACIRCVSESIASLPLGLFRRLQGGKGKELAIGMPLHLVLSEQPNDWMTSFEFRELMQTWCMLWGAAYALIKPGRFGAVTELHPLHPSRVTAERTKSGKLRFMYKDPNQLEPVPYTQEQIFRVTWMTKDGLNPYVPTIINRDAIALARATEIHSSAYFGNGARPGVILESDQPLKPETRKQLRDTWDDLHGGPGNSSKTAVMPPGIRVKELSGTNESAQLIETRRYQVEDIARAMRVPAYMIGDLTKSSYSSVEQQGLDFVTFTLIPWLRRWEGAIRRDLVSDDANYFAEFDVRALLKGDASGRASYYRELWQLGVLSINEIRNAEGMNPIADGDKRFIQVNMALLESFVVQPPADQAADGTGATPPEADTSAAPPADQTQPPADDAARAAADVVFTSTLRRLAAIEADGILERRNKPARLTAWLGAHEKKMRTELMDSANATGRQIDTFVSDWMNTTRELLLDCHRSGRKYEEVLGTWTSRVDKTAS